MAADSRDCQSPLRSAPGAAVRSPVSCCRSAPKAHVMTGVAANSHETYAKEPCENRIVPFMLPQAAPSFAATRSASQPVGSAS